MQSFVFNTTESLVFRTGAASQLAAAAGALLGSRVLFVTDPGLRKLGLCNPAITSFESAGVSVTVFDQVEADPSRLRS